MKPLFVDTKVSPSSPGSRAHRVLWQVVACVLVSWAVHNMFLLRWEASHWRGAWAAMAPVALRAAAWLVPAFVYLRHFDRRPLGNALGLTTRPDLARAWLWIGLPIVWILVVTVLQETNNERAAAPILAWMAQGVAGGAWVSASLAVVLEELLMRGFFLRQLLRHVGPKAAIVSSSALFAAMHLPGWIAQTGTVDAGIIVSTVVLFVLALVLATVTWASESLWIAIALHAANNLVAAWLGGS